MDKFYSVSRAVSPWPERQSLASVGEGLVFRGKPDTAHCSYAHTISSARFVSR